MVILGWPLNFLRQGQILVPMHLYGEKSENSVSKNLLKAYDWNLQCMIKVANRFSYNQNFAPPPPAPLTHTHTRGYLPLPQGYIHV